MGEVIDFKDIKKEYDSLGIDKQDFNYKNNSSKVILFSDIQQKYNKLYKTCNNE